MARSAVVVGCGSVGLRHLRNLAAAGVETLATVDPEPSRLQAAQKAVPSAALYTRLDDALRDRPEVVVVANPTSVHVPSALAAAAGGCHLLIEKPLSHRLDGVDDLVAAVAERGLITLVGCNMRFHPGVVAVKRLVEEGTVGNVLSSRLYTGSYLPDWRADRSLASVYSSSPEFGGGAILDCIHELDLALWLFGPARVAAAETVGAGSIGLEIEGIAEILLRHRGGCLSSVHLNVLQRDYHRGVEIVGTEGTIYWSFEAKSVRVSRGRTEEFIADPLGWEVNEMYRDELSYFLDCVGATRPTFNTVSDGLATLEVALAAKERAEASASSLSA